MKKLMCAVFVLCLLPYGRLSAQEQSRKELAEELLNLMNVRGLIEAKMAQLKTVLPAAEKEIAQSGGQSTVSAKDAASTASALATVEEMFKWDNVKGDYIALYAKTLTEDELKGAIAFYKSPVGQSFAGKQEDLMMGVTEISKKRLIEIMQKMKNLKSQTGSSKSQSPVPIE